MPTKTYFNLKEDKQKLVYRAVFDEFTRVPLEEVSVKNIVTSADIPRGSFYQYFNDKEEALVYLITETKNQGHEELGQSNNEMQLDIFEFMERVFVSEINKIKNKELSDRLRLLKQIVKSPKATSVFYSVMSGSRLDHPVLEKCWKNMGMSDKVDLQEIKTSIFDLVFATLKDCLILAIDSEEGIDASINQFKLKMNIIKLGVNQLGR
ncbi:TetR/AcrR family transcriptional regulator [Alkaliphilus hydrothermalis]|uniref:AcrR family transcriptional regulator n=1 Tax=Alkaliphilus hydrothermalis TaxID=1482730 RepID=A0ABS2NMJ2_9FIRM|nr:TetR/AcrR family transcriptional regulator [Alkaliphilus hydrothermalis]MBM7614148.1 AcrR family transcriptional regulator [Alkaliphilus hydrothermalis]